MTLSELKGWISANIYTTANRQNSGESLKTVLTKIVDELYASGGGGSLNPTTGKIPKRGASSFVDSIIEETSGKVKISGDLEVVGTLVGMPTGGGSGSSSYVIDIRDYGATPTNANNHTYINQAITDAAAGDTVYFPKGTWILKSPINVDKGNVKLQGEGMYSTISFQPTDALTDGIFMRGFDNALDNLSIIVNDKVTNAIRLKGNGSRPVLTRLLLEGPNTKPAGKRGIYFDGDPAAVYIATVSGVKLQYFNTAMDLNGEVHGMFHDMQFHQPNVGVRVNNLGGLSVFSDCFAQTYEDVFFDCHSNGNIFLGIQGEANAAAPKTRPVIRFNSSSAYNQYLGTLNTGSGKNVEDLNGNNYGFANNQMKALSLKMKPDYGTYVEPNSLYVELGAGKRLAFKDEAGNIHFLTPVVA